MTPDVDPLDLVDPARYARNGYPHAVWTRLRAEAPVAYFESPGLEPFWAITKHADIAQISRKPLRFSSAQGIGLRRANALVVSGRPRPIQNPIPIWIGGNSKLARRRVAERAQGWMPMVNAEPAGIPTSTVTATARAPLIRSIDQLAGMVSEIREEAAAAGRTDAIDVLCYHRFSDRSPAHEADRHREALANLERPASPGWS